MNAKLLAKAIALAAEKHQDQFDRAGVPYILHCMKVMHYCKTDDVEIMCIAVMHDLLEDTNLIPGDLNKMGFSSRVIEGVIALSKNFSENDEKYMENILKNPDASRVKLADLRHNSDIRRLKGITEKDVERMKKYHAMYLRLKDALPV